MFLVPSTNLFTCLFSYQPQNHEIMFGNILAEEVRFPSKISSEARDLLGGLLVKDPTHRLGGGRHDARDIMNHVFFCLDRLGIARPEKGKRKKKLINQHSLKNVQKRHLPSMVDLLKSLPSPIVILCLIVFLRLATNGNSRGSLLRIKVST